MSRVITVSEYSRIYVNQKYGDVTITREDILELKSFIDNHNSETSKNTGNYSDFMTPIRNGVQLNNYVGVLQTKSNLTIEVLPKIYKNSETKKNQDDIRELFFKMLKTVRHINGKKFRMTHLNTRKQNIFEVFISMFLEESNQIFKQGLSSNYVTIKSNERFRKGKLCMVEHLRLNQTDASKFYNEFDEFLSDTLENQILKNTLLILLKVSKDNNNLRLIREQLIYLETVRNTIINENSFNQVILNRSFSYYEQTLEWCHVFFKGTSFTSFKGEALAVAILFPMEKLFESYIAKVAKTQLMDDKVVSQDSSYWLFDKTEKTSQSYQLKPDLVIKKESGELIIADTKWKILDKYGPSQSDLYQMYAYYSRYKANFEDVKKVLLIYPYSEKYPEKEFLSIDNSEEKIGAKIQIKYIDLLSDNLEENLKELFN